MTFRVRFFFVVIASVPSTSCHSSGASLPPSTVAAAAALPKSDIQRENDETERQVLASIAGRERDSAGKVFVNVKWLAATRAATFLSIMNEGYAKALGVRCTHCHVPDDFASDEKQAKRAAREMQVMHRMINQELARMQHLRTPPTENRAINCATCHRGAVNPRER